MPLEVAVGGTSFALGWPSIRLTALVLFGAVLRPAFLTTLFLLQERLSGWLGLDADHMSILIGVTILGTLIATLASKLLLGIVGLGRAITWSTVWTILVIGVLVACEASLPESGWLRVAVLSGFVFALGALTGVLTVAMKTLVAEQEADGSNHALNAAWSAGAPIGLCLGAVASDLSIFGASWSLPFLATVAVALCLLALDLLDRGLGGSRRAVEAHRTQPDWLGFALICGFLVAFELWSISSDLAGWDSLVALAFVIATVVAAMVAVRHARRAPSPAISLRPFGVPSFGLAVIICLVMEISTTGEFELVFLESVDRLPGITLGDRTVFGNVAAVAGTILAGGLLARLRTEAVVIAGLLVLTLGLVMYCAYPAHDSRLFVTVTRGVTGFGHGFVLPAVLVLAQVGLAASWKADASALIVGMLLLGNEIGLALFQLVLDLAEQMSGSATAGYLTVFTLQASLVGLLIPATLIGARKDSSAG